MTKLADKIEALEGPSWEVDAEIMCHIGRAEVRDGSLYRMHPQVGSTHMLVHSPTPYTASLDAAMTLVPEGWCKTVADYWCESDDKPPFFADCGDLPAVKRGDKDAVIVEAYANTPALALCAAALRAREANR